MPSISVIIPTHNRKQFLAEAVECVLRQTLTPSEIIIVDNGTDSEAEKSVWPEPIQYIRTIANAGASQARNIGATIATSEYLAFLDDDDLWENAYLEKAVSALTVRPTDILLARLDWLSESGCVSWRCPTKETLTKGTFVVTNPGVTGSNIIVSRRHFFSLGGFNSRLRTGEDKALIIDSLDRDASIQVVPSMQAMHRAHDLSSLSRDEFDNGLRDFCECYAEKLTLTQKIYLQLKAKHYEHIKTGRHPVHSVLFRAVRKFERIATKK